VRHVPLMPRHQRAEAIDLHRAALSTLHGIRGIDVIVPPSKDRNDMNAEGAQWHQCGYRCQCAHSVFMSSCPVGIGIACAPSALLSLCPFGIDVIAPLRHCCHVCRFGIRPSGRPTLRHSIVRIRSSNATRQYLRASRQVEACRGARHLASPRSTCGVTAARCMLRESCAFHVARTGARCMLHGRCA
jgi:hypothetical protein